MLPLCVDQSGRPPQPHGATRAVSHSSSTVADHAASSLVTLLPYRYPTPGRRASSPLCRPHMVGFILGVMTQNLHTAFSITNNIRRWAASQWRSAATLSCGFALFFCFFFFFFFATNLAPTPPPPKAPQAHNMPCCIADVKQSVLKTEKFGGII